MFLHFFKLVMGKEYSIEEKLLIGYIAVLWWIETRFSYCIIWEKDRNI